MGDSSNFDVLANDSIDDRIGITLQNMIAVLPTTLRITIWVREDLAHTFLDCGFKTNCRTFATFQIPSERFLIVRQRGFR